MRIYLEYLYQLLHLKWYKLVVYILLTHSIIYVGVDSNTKSNQFVLQKNNLSHAKVIC